MSKQDNLTDFLTDVADAIREKKGTTEKINPQNFSDEIKSINTSIWTGHVDVEGLKAIGWTDEDIAYYQAHGVNWMEEDDELHKVSDDNKALYGVLTADNIAVYKDRIVYLPKIDTSGRKSIEKMFFECNRMVGIPFIDTSNVTNMNRTFAYCNSLTCIPEIDTSKVVIMEYLFIACYNLRYIPTLNTKNVTDANWAFGYCYSLETVPAINMSSLSRASSMFYSCTSLEVLYMVVPKITIVNTLIALCTSLKYISEIDLSSATSYNQFLTENYCLKDIRFKGVSFSISISHSRMLSKKSILYMIENEAAAEAITITLHAYAYERLANDPEVLEALSNHPLITLAST